MHDRGVDRPIVDLARALRARELTAQSLVDACLERIASGSSLNAFTAVFERQAREDARQADLDLAAGSDRGLLHGIPVSIKDIIDVEGTPTTAASRVRVGHLANRDAPVVRRLRNAGAVLIGKCNLHEFAFGTTSDESMFGPVRHPLDPARSPGGSSGGSAVAVRTGMSVASIGTDTGGSVRIPAAACGVVGLKPTYGTIPCEGVVPLSRSLDHVGPITRTVADASIVYSALKNETPAAPDARPVAGLTLGVPRAYFLDVLDEEVRQQFEGAVERLANAGASVREVKIVHAADIAPIYLHLALPEAAAFHRVSLERAPEDYSPGVRCRLEMGRYILAEDYVTALKGREILRQDVDRALVGLDALVLPSLAIPAPPLGAATINVAGTSEPVRNVMLRLTQLFNLTGHPAISIPCGTTGAGLPCGLQLAGRLGQTRALLGLAAACEPLMAVTESMSPTGQV